MRLKITKAVIFSLIAAVCAIAVAIGIAFAVKELDKKVNFSSTLETPPTISTASPLKADVVVESEPSPEPVHIPVENLTLNKYEVNVMQGGSDMPIVAMHPANATNLAEIWTSDNPAVATVNGFGKITGVSEGRLYGYCTLCR